MRGKKENPLTPWGNEKQTSKRTCHQRQIIPREIATKKKTIATPQESPPLRILLTKKGGKKRGDEPAADKEKEWKKARPSPCHPLCNSRRAKDRCRHAPTRSKAEQNGRGENNNNKPVQYKVQSISIRRARKRDKESGNLKTGKKKQ